MLKIELDKYNYTREEARELCGGDDTMERVVLILLEEITAKKKELERLETRTLRSLKTVAAQINDDDIAVELDDVLTRHRVVRRLRSDIDALRELYFLMMELSG